MIGTTVINLWHNIFLVLPRHNADGYALYEHPVFAKSQVDLNKPSWLLFSTYQYTEILDRYNVARFRG